MDRDCNKCINHISGDCSSWDCQMETLEEHDQKIKEAAIDEFKRIFFEEDFGLYETTEHFMDRVCELAKGGEVNEHVD